jgi:RNA polymerase sigma factor (sigma-70 family)
VNLAIDSYRARGPGKGPARTGVDQEAGEGVIDSLASPGTPASPGPLEALETKELGAVFERIAARLGARQRAIFVMSQIEGTSTEEIARILGISHSTVRNHLFQARRTLQEQLRALFPEYAPPRRGEKSD